MLQSSDSTSGSSDAFVEQGKLFKQYAEMDVKLEQRITRSYQCRPISSDESVCSADDVANRRESTYDNNHFVATENGNNSQVKTVPKLNRQHRKDTRWPSMEAISHQVEMKCRLKPVPFV